MRVMTWLDDSWWRIPLLILACGAVIGLITYAATAPHASCHMAVTAAGSRPYLLLKCR